MRKMQSCRGAMWYLALLVVFGADTVNGQLECPPTVIGSNFLGGITQTTVTIQNNICCISQLPGILSTDQVAILFGLSSAMTSIDFNTIDITNLPKPINFSTSGITTALLGQIGVLCPPNVNLAAGIRLGNDIFCVNLPTAVFCNSPILLGPGPYSAIAIVFRGNNIVGITRISQPILLKNPKPFNSIDTTIKNRSAGMIAITVILPILFALLLVTFSTMLFFKCCCCSVFTPSKCQQE